MKKTIFILFCLLTLNLYDFIYIESLKIIYSIFFVYFAGYILTHKVKKASPFSFQKNLRWITISIIISSLFGIVFWKQTIYDILKADIPNITILLSYFYLKRISISEKFIIKTLLTLVIIWGLIEWGQQITYPHVYFQGRENLEVRMGLYRFYITGIHFAIIILLYYVAKIYTDPHNRKKNLTIWFIALISIIGYVSRKQIYASILCSAIAIFTLRGKNKIAVLTASIIALGVGLFYLSDIMLELNTQTMEELNDDEFIRFVTTDYFMFHFSDSPIYYLFGTGPALGSSGIGQAFIDLQEESHLYRADCGIVGYFTSYGLIGCIIFILPLIRILLKWKILFPWQKLYLLYFLMMITMAFWGNSHMGLFSFVLFLFFVEQNINDNEYCICSKQPKG